MAALAATPAERSNAAVLLGAFGAEVAVALLAGVAGEAPAAGILARTLEPERSPVEPAAAVAAPAVAVIREEAPTAAERHGRMAAAPAGAPGAFPGRPPAVGVAGMAFAGRFESPAERLPSYGVTTVEPAAEGLTD